MFSQGVLLHFSVIEVIIEEPSCTSGGVSGQVFKYFKLLSSQSSLRKVDKFQVLESYAVAVFSDFLNHICFSTLYLSIFIDVLS